MKTKIFLAARALFAAGCCFTLGNAIAAEYYLGVNGDDANPGTSEERPLATLAQVGKILQPGDTVILLPGEYHQELYLSFPGHKDQPTTFKAKIRGSVHLRGDQPAPTFAPVPDRPDVYYCQVEKMPEYVLERDSLKKYQKVPAISEVSYTPGSSFLDYENSTVYIRCYDSQAPDTHQVTFSYLRGDAFRFNNQENSEGVQNLHFDGLLFSGYNSAEPMVGASSTYGGIYISWPRNCSIRHCSAYLNGSGIVLARPIDTLIEDCVLFANSTEFNGSGGNLICYGPAERTHQRRIITFASEMAGQRFYGGIFDDCWIEDCIAFDNGYGDIWIKYPSDSSGVRRCYASRAIHSRINMNCIFTSGDEGYFGQAQGSISRAREKKFDENYEFADPSSLDFRLQGDSRFRGKDGQPDLGLGPYDERILYVSNKGDDQNDGNSLRTPLKSLAAAAARLQEGATLYLAPGDYQEDLLLTGKKQLIVRGRGDWPVVLAGKVIMQDCAEVTLENLNVLGGLQADCQALQLRKCAFLAALTLPADADVRHCAFVGAVQTGPGAFLRANIFAAGLTGTPQFSGSNSFAGAVPTSEVNSFTAVPRFSAPEKGVFTLLNYNAFSGRSADGFPVGPYRYIRAAVPAKMSAQLGSVSASTANFMFSGNATPWANLTYGRDESCSDGKVTGGGEPYFSISLTGLEPGTRYYYKVSGSFDAEKRLTNAPEIPQSTFAVPLGDFTTPVVDQPKTWYVASNGSNQNSGLSVEQPLAEIGYATFRATAGDTILVQGGTYRENVRVMSTGDEGKKLTIAGVFGQRVIIDGCNSLSRGFLLRNKKNIAVDYFHITGNFGNCSLGAAGGIVAYNCPDLQISRIFYDNRVGKGQYIINAHKCPNLLMENCIGHTSFSGFYFAACENLEVRNNVFIRNKVSHGRVGTTMTAPAHVHHNVFAGHVLQKVQNAAFSINEVTTLREDNNCFLYRVGRKEKPIFGVSRENDQVLPESHYNDIMTTEWKRQGRFARDIRTYDDFCQRFQRQPTAIFADPKMKALPYFYRFKDIEDWHENYILGKASEEQKELFRKASREEGNIQADGTPAAVDFTDYLATDPEILRRGIGLQPERFQ